MTEVAALAELFSALNIYVWPALRIGAFVMVMPLVGSTFVPVTVRLLIALALTIVVTPILPEFTAPDIFSLAGMIAVAQELAIGVAMGFVLQLLFDAVTLGGQLIAMSMGLGFAVFLDRARGINVPVLGQLFLLLSMLLFLSLDGHLAAIAILAESFTLVPIAEGGLGLPAAGRILAWTALLFVLALKIALPALTALLVVNLSFGVMSRAAPTLNLFAVGFPVAMLMGFVVIFLNMGALQESFTQFLGETLTTLPILLVP